MFNSISCFLFESCLIQFLWVYNSSYKSMPFTPLVHSVQCRVTCALFEVPVDFCRCFGIWGFHSAFVLFLLFEPMLCSFVSTFNSLESCIFQSYAIYFRANISLADKIYKGLVLPSQWGMIQVLSIFLISLFIKKSASSQVWRTFA